MARIEGLRVRNFRSIGDWVSVDFPDAVPLVLLGENNVGKSNVVRALSFLLGERWPSKVPPEDHELHQRSRDNVPIQIHAQVNGVFSGRGDEIEAIEWSWDPTRDGDPFRYVGATGDGYPNYMSHEIRSQLFCMTVGVDRSLRYQMSYSSQWTLLSRLTKRFHDALIEDEQRVERLKRHYEDVKAVFREVESFEQFSSGLKSHVAHLSANLEYALEVDFAAYDPTNYFKSLQVYPHAASEVRNFDELGTGQEQILALAFAYAYAVAFGEGDSGLVLAIEEPEAHLHPLAQRWLARRVTELASTGVQVVLTTHSPAFVDMLALDGLVLLRKNDVDATAVTQRSSKELADYCAQHGSPESTADEVRSFYSGTATTEIENGYFARRCLLVEGPTEALALPHLFQRIGVDLLKERVEVVAVGGLGSLARWWRMFTFYGVPTFVLFDSDSDKSGKKAETATRDRNDLLDAMGVKVDYAALALEGGLEVSRWFAVADSNYENSMHAMFPEQYAALEDQAVQELGSLSKQLKARYVAQRLDVAKDLPGWEKVRALARAVSSVSQFDHSGCAHTVDEPIETQP